MDGLPGTWEPVPRGQGRFNNNKTEQVKKALQYIFAKHLMCSWGMIGNVWERLDSLQGSSLATNGQIIFGSCHNMSQSYPAFCILLASWLCCRVFNLSFQCFDGFNFIQLPDEAIDGGWWRMQVPLCAHEEQSSLRVPCPLVVHWDVTERMTWKSCVKPLQVISPGYVMIHHNQY